jgi:hypothetical protein
MQPFREDHAYKVVALVNRDNVEGLSDSLLSLRYLRKVKEALRNSSLAWGGIARTEDRVWVQAGSWYSCMISYRIVASLPTQLGIEVRPCAVQSYLMLELET